MPSKEHNVRVDGLVPPKCAPPNCTLSSTTELMGNFSPPTRTGPYVCLDSTGHAPPRSFPFQNVCLHPKPICIQRIRYSMIRLSRLVCPMVVLKFLVVIVDPGCSAQLKKLFLHKINVITTYYLELLHLTSESSPSVWREPKGCLHLRHDDSSWRLAP